MRYTIPIVKIEPYGVVVYNKYLYDTDKFNTSHDRTNLLFENQDEKYSKFSIGSRRRLKRAFCLLHSISNPQSVYDPKIEKTIKFTLNMITLTLSAKQGIYTDKTIKNKLLNDFLTRLRMGQGLKSYIWRAEPQKNNNIHFHIITNKYFNYQYIRDTWNNVQKKLGYINLFNEKHHHINPNSTDIHSIRNIQNADRYIGKYIRKMKEEEREIEGKYWDCSIDLKSKVKCSIECEGDNIDLLNSFECQFADRLFLNDNFKFYNLNHFELLKYLPCNWLNEYKNYISIIKSIT